MSKEPKEKNKLDIYKIIIDILAIIMLLMILFAIITSMKTKEDINERQIFVTILCSVITACASLIVGMLAFRQNKLMKEENEAYREQIREENEKYRQQDLLIRTTPYVSLKGIDFVGANQSLGEVAEASEIVVQDGKFNNDNTYTALTLRLCLNCKQASGLKQIDFNYVELYTDYDNFHGKHKYVFENSKQGREGYISIYKENEYQCFLILATSKDDLEESSHWLCFLTNRICSGTNSFHISYTAYNLYGVKVSGEMKFLCKMRKKNQNEYEVTELSNMSNWIDETIIESKENSNGQTNNAD